MKRIRRATNYEDTDSPFSDPRELNRIPEEKELRVLENWEFDGAQLNMAHLISTENKLEKMFFIRVGNPVVWLFSYNPKTPKTFKMHFKSEYTAKTKSGIRFFGMHYLRSNEEYPRRKQKKQEYDKQRFFFTNDDSEDFEEYIRRIETEYSKNPFVEVGYFDNFDEDRVYILFLGNYIFSLISSSKTEIEDHINDISLAPKYKKFTGDAGFLISYALEDLLSKNQDSRREKSRKDFSKAEILAANISLRERSDYRIVTMFPAKKK